MTKKKREKKTVFRTTWCWDGGSILSREKWGEEKLKR